MSRPRVTLYDFVPYGAPELLEVRETYLTRALATASTGIVVLFAIAIAATTWLAGHAGETIISNEKVRILSPTPVFVPPIALPMQPKAPSVAPRKSARAEPVPDRLAPQDQTIASQDDLRQTNPGDVHETGGGVVPDAPIAVEAVPGITDWVYYDEAPAVVSQVKPLYPDMAREAGVDGTVQLRVLVGKDGRVKDVHVDRSIPLLDEAAVAAARLWVFTPALSNGHPVMVWLAVPIRFTLHH
jgi:protein TonB